MDRNDAKKRLTEVFRKTFGDDAIEVSEETTSEEIEDWDSLAHINLIAGIEDEFGMRFKTKEVSGMKNVGEILDAICERGK